MQALIFEAAETPGVDKRELAQLACAWQRLEAERRNLKMRPAPKPVDVSLPARRDQAGRSGLSGVGIRAHTDPVTVQAAAQAA
jgi:hypothetical protein